MAKSNKKQKNNNPVENMTQPVTPQEPVVTPKPKNMLLEQFDFSIDAGKVITVIILLLLMTGTVLGATQVLPNVVTDNTDEAVASREREKTEREQREKEAEIQALLDAEKDLVFTDREVKMSFKDFGEIKLDLRDQAAPKTVENFVRLVNRSRYDGNKIHRIVESDTFSVIQGGDTTNGDGTGGEVADGTFVPDELWKEAPVTTTDENGTTTITNDPVFADDELYTDYNKELGVVTYKKGQILMAKTSQPNSASSQFFITLNDTTLPAEYTVFGVVTEGIEVLDKIKDEVEPIPNPAIPAQEGYKDGAPDKDIVIESASLL